MAQAQPQFAPQPLHPGLEALEDGFCMLDAEGRVTYWNAAAERMLHMPRASVLGRSVAHALPFMVTPAGRDRLERAHEERATAYFLERLGGSAGGYAAVRATPLPEGGSAIHLRDCSEEIRRAERYVALLESIRDGFIAVDDHWNITYLNSVAESLLRLSRQQAVGLSLWSLLPEEPPDIRECLQATLQDGQHRHLAQVTLSDRVVAGRRFDLWAQPLAGGGISVFIEDVTDRFEREQQLARLAAEAEELNRAKSRFFTAVSHELRTPLNAIVGYTHLLNTGTYGPIPDPARRAADRAGVCAEHLARLVDDVLLLTGSEIGRLPVSPAPLNLQEYLPATVAPLELQAQAKGLFFELRIAPDLPVVQTDPQRLRQLLLALLSNAVKFTSRGGVSLAVCIVDPAATVAAAPNGTASPSEPQLEIIVEDTGPGVPSPDRERIFGLFEQVGDDARSESMTRGPGIGLTIARQLARLLGGDLRLADTSPAGSKFALHLPLSLPIADGGP